MTIPQALQIALQHHQAGRLAEAEGIYRQILAVQPNHADALHLLGLIAHQAGHHGAAADLIRHAILIDPNNPFAHSNLGETLRAMGQLDEAIGAYRCAVRLNPDFPEAHNNLGNALRERDQLDEAVTALYRALELKPDYPDAHYNLGNALRDQGELDKAVAAYRHALHSKPNYPEAHNNLGNALKERGQLDQSIAAYRHALELRPAYPEAHSNLGNALWEQGLFDEAISASSRAIQLRPAYPEAHSNLGNALRDQDRLDEAIAAYRRALELKPEFADAHNNIGNTLKDLGKLDEAIDAFRRAIRLSPENARFHSNLVYTLHFHPGYSGGMISEEHARWNRQFADPLKPFILPHSNDRTPDRRLRVGYVSPEFRDHVTGRYLLPLFKNHDRRNFEILCYSGVTRADVLTEEFRRCADRWRSTVSVGDEALAEVIRQDGVDILVDLTQHMAGNRLTMFARKPAPVQVSFAGYPDSTGLETIEYRISDRYLEGSSPDGQMGRREHVSMIESFWCYDSCGVEVEVNGLPARESGGITFGSLNNFCKVNSGVLSLWARVLRNVEGSRLIILAGEGSHRQRTVDALEREGVESRRVEFVEFRPRREYLELYHRLDIALDTFPSNGHTTSLDALWMGVPVVSLVGNTPVSRAGLSQLTNLGLSELAVRSETEYVNIAESLAATANLSRLAELRSTLRLRMQASPLMDAPRFARSIENAYRFMWERWLLRHR